MAPEDVFVKPFFSRKKRRQCLKEDRILKMFRTFETGCSQRIIFT